MQPQLGTAASHLPTHNPYGYGNSAMLLHPRVMALKEEYRSDDNASSSSSSDDKASSTPLLPLMQTWTYRTCDQPLPGVMHKSTDILIKGKKCRTYRTDNKNFVSPDRRAAFSLRHFSMPTRRQAFVVVKRQAIWIVGISNPRICVFDRRRRCCWCRFRCVQWRHG